MVGQERRLALEEILNEKQIHQILTRFAGEDIPWNLEGSKVKPAVDGIAGFLADHMRAVLHVDVKGEKKKLHLFLKRIPKYNEAKAKFVKEGQFFTRELFMYKLMEDICADGVKNPWCVKPYICTESMFVMPDISFEGYKIQNSLETLDLDHILVATASIARFHADFVNYETRKSIELKRPYDSFQEFGHLLLEGNFLDCPWLSAAVKLSANLIKAFSTKPYRNMPDLQQKLAKLYLEACGDLRNYKGTVNVLLHKDLWVNNIMFKYENNVPINAIFVDFQSIRYAPPAFDLVMFLYFTTDKTFREEREKDIFDYYYSVFIENLTIESKKRLDDLGYDKGNFLSWCERARKLSMIVSMSIYPYALMDSKTAEEVFDNSETSHKHMEEDRTEPVLAHANRCETYKLRNLAINEEFVEKYLLTQM